MKLPVALLLAALAVVCAAPLLAPNAPAMRFNGLLNAPPTRVHVRDTSGHWHAPFIHALRRLSQLEQTYEEDAGTHVPLHWFSGGQLVQSSQPETAPLLLTWDLRLSPEQFERVCESNPEAVLELAADGVAAESFGTDEGARVGDDVSGDLDIAADLHFRRRRFLRGLLVGESLGSLEHDNFSFRRA